MNMKIEKEELYVECSQLIWIDRKNLPARWGSHSI
jgi:hypothetical protein